MLPGYTFKILSARPVDGPTNFSIKMKEYNKNYRTQIVQTALNGHIKNGLIAFFDILGFKDLVFENTHLKLSAIYQILFDFMIKRKSEELIRGDEEIVNFFKFGQTNPIKSIIISDSIILWSNKCTLNEFTKLLIIVESLLQLGLHTGLPLRGAITSGEFSAINLTGNFTIFGKGLTNAYLLEANQNWSGCLVDTKTIKFIKSISKESSIKEKTNLCGFNNIVKYNIPLKRQQTEIQYAINWIDSEFSEEDIKNSFSSHLKRVDHDKVSGLIKHTIDFGKFVTQMDNQSKRNVLNDLLDKDFLKLYDKVNNSA